MCDISDWAMEETRKLFEPHLNIKEKNEKIFSKKPIPIFISTPKKGEIDWGEIADLQSFNAEIVKNSDVTKLSAESHEEELFRFALKFRTREVWVYQKRKYENGVITIDFLLYPSRMNLKDCESTCYNFDRIIFMKRSEFRKLPKTKNFFLVLKYRKTMRKFLGVTR